MRLGTAASQVTSNNCGLPSKEQKQSIHDGSSQCIANNHYTATNHPFLKGNEAIYNINNPKLGML